MRILIDGLLVGVATGLVGAGGGFLIVPALNLLGGLPMAVAIGTSLLVITMKSFAGLGGYLFSLQLNWLIVFVFTATAVAGSFVGVALTGRIPERALRNAFGICIGCALQARFGKQPPRYCPANTCEASPATRVNAP